MFDFLHDDTALGNRILDTIETRSRVALHNLANQNTPGFKRYEVRFEDLLRQAADRGKPLGDVHAVVERIDDGPMDQNNVDPMQQLATLDKVRLLHEVFSRRVGGYFSHLRTAIRGTP